MIHRAIRTATTHVGSSCACSGGQSRFSLVLVMISGNQKQFRTANHTTVSCCRHCDGEVAIHSTNGNLMLLTRLLSLCKIQVIPRVFYTMRYIDDAK